MTAPDPHPSEGGIRICGLLIGRKRNGYGDDCALYCGLPQGHEGRHGRKIPASEALSLGASDEGAGPGGGDDPSAPQPVCGCPPDNCNWAGPSYNGPPEGCRLAPVHPSEQAEKRCTCQHAPRWAGATPQEIEPDPDCPLHSQPPSDEERWTLVDDPTDDPGGIAVYGYGPEIGEKSKVEVVPAADRDRLELELSTEKHLRYHAEADRDRLKAEIRQALRDSDLDRLRALSQPSDSGEKP